MFKNLLRRVFGRRNRNPLDDFADTEMRDGVMKVTVRKTGKVYLFSDRPHPLTAVKRVGG